MSGADALAEELRALRAAVEALGRQFNPWHFRHPVEGMTWGAGFGD